MTKVGGTTAEVSSLSRSEGHFLVELILSDLSHKVSCIQHGIERLCTSLAYLGSLVCSCASRTSAPQTELSQFQAR